MNDLPKLYFTMERYLFPLLEEELGELTAKMREFLRIVEVVRPSRFITSALRWCGLGRPMKDREKMLRAFFLKAVYDFPTTKALIENLKTNLQSFCRGKSSGCRSRDDCEGKLHGKAGRTRKHRFHGNRRKRKGLPQEYAEDQAQKEAGPEKQSGKSGTGGTGTFRNQNPAS